MLAKKLKLKFYDSDREVEKRSGVDIDWMFSVEGESGFRQRELLIIEELCQEHGILIATGGGTVTIDHARDLLKDNGTVIYLQVPFEQQLHRVKRFPEKRPMLDKNDPALRLEELNTEREALYDMIADFTFTNKDEQPHQIVRRIIKDLKMQ